MPDIGPKPIRITKKIAHISAGRLLKEASKILITEEIPGVLRFLAASRERGRDIVIPKTVDMNAIFNVSDIPIQAVEQVIENPRGALHSGYSLGSKILQSGGQRDSTKKVFKFPNPVDSLPQSSTAPRAK